MGLGERGRHCRIAGLQDCRKVEGKKGKRLEALKDRRLKDRRLKDRRLKDRRAEGQKG
jgi:hypothetical protein